MEQNSVDWATIFWIVVIVAVVAGCIINWVRSANKKREKEALRLSSESTSEEVAAPAEEEATPEPEEPEESGIDHIRVLAEDGTLAYECDMPAENTYDNEGRGIFINEKEITYKRLCIGNACAMIVEGQPRKTKKDDEPDEEQKYFSVKLISSKNPVVPLAEWVVKNSWDDEDDDDVSKGFFKAELKNGCILLVFFAASHFLVIDEIVDKG